MERYSRRSSLDPESLAEIALGGLTPILVGALLVPLRDHVAAVNLALGFTVVVVAAGALGGRAAGAMAALTAAMSFDFFLTRPYLSLLIHNRDDLEMTGLLLALGLIAGQLASVLRSTRRRLADEHRELESIRHLADEVAHGTPSDDVITLAEAELTALLDLAACHFEPAPFTHSRDLPALEPGAGHTHRRYHIRPDGDLELELPPGDVVLPVLARGRLAGRFVLGLQPEASATLEQRAVAIVIAEQVGAALAAPATQQRS